MPQMSYVWAHYCCQIYQTTTITLKETHYLNKLFSNHYLNRKIKQVLSRSKRFVIITRSHRFQQHKLINMRCKFSYNFKAQGQDFVLGVYIFNSTQFHNRPTNPSLPAASWFTSQPRYMLHVALYSSTYPLSTSTSLTIPTAFKLLCRKRK